VAYALELMMEDAKSPGETYELYGPGEFTYAQVSDMVTETIMRTKRRINVPKPVALGVTKLLSYLPWPYISPDEIERMCIDDRVTPDAKTFDDLNIVPRRIDITMLEVVRRYRKSALLEEPPRDPKRPKGAHIVY
jgi:NADH dehydrogenase (ubiquinone) 1 alpha subcomplex subunit 9